MRLKTILATPALLFICAVLPVTGQQVREQQVRKQQGVYVTPLLKTSTTLSGQQIQYPKTNSPEITSLLVEIKPGGQTGWHKHPVPSYGYILEGTLTVKTGDGHQREFKAGDAAVEDVNICHNGKNLGNTPVKILAVFMGEQGKANSLPCPSSREDNGKNGVK